MEAGAVSPMIGGEPKPIPVLSAPVDALPLAAKPEPAGKPR